jgi:uncharacterized iron-regulated membrane protein
MTFWERWVRRPQSLWIRKLIFQVHLWAGIGVGLYVTVISVSGSAIVFRRALQPRIFVAADAGRPRMQDLRRSRLEVARVLGWLTNLHDNLLSGLTGRTLNGLGAFLVILLACTGAVIWWPGIRNWRRSLGIHRKVRFARLIWDLHSAVGIWCLLFVLIWGLSGFWLCFPGTLDFLMSAELRAWIIRLHFGRFNSVTEALWTVLGLAPAVLAATGAVMWWNRVLSKKSAIFGLAGEGKMPGAAPAKLRLTPGPTR